MENLLQDFYSSSSTAKPAPEDLTIKLSDFYPPGQEPNGESFTLVWHNIIKKIERARRRLAFLRYLSSIKKHMAQRDRGAADGKKVRSGMGPTSQSGK